MARLVDLHGIEESLDDHYGLILRSARAVQIEKNLRLPKPGRKTIFRLRAVNHASGVGDQLTIFIVDRDYYMSFEKTGARIKSGTKGSNCGRLDGAGPKVRMATINIAKNKAERTI